MALSIKKYVVVHSSKTPAAF